MGQNFLINVAVLEKLVRAARVRRDETILEIGAGTGILTESLLRGGARVVAVEKDTQLVALLQKKFAGMEHLTIVSGDALKLSSEFFRDLGQYRVIANIPYYLTARLMRKLLEEVQSPKEIIVMVQKEVADRIVSAPPHMNLVALAVQLYGEPEKLFDIAKESFWPAPEVDSTVIRISGISDARFASSRVAPREVFRLIRASFQAKRKMVGPTLAKFLRMPPRALDPILRQAGISSSARPAEIHPNQWITLASLIAAERIDVVE